MLLYTLVCHYTFLACCLSLLPFVLLNWCQQFLPLPLLLLIFTCLGAWSKQKDTKIRYARLISLFKVASATAVLCSCLCYTSAAARGYLTTTYPIQMEAGEWKYRFRIGAVKGDFQSVYASRPFTYPLCFTIRESSSSLPWLSCAHWMPRLLSCLFIFFINKKSRKTYYPDADDGILSKRHARFLSSHGASVARL